MRYTQGQIRELLRMTVDEFRTWRDAIPALASHKGHAPSFTPGDVVAMAIVGELVRHFGVRVGLVGDRFDRLFRECRGKSWIYLGSCIAIIETEEVRLIDAVVPNRQEPNISSICVPCGPIVSRLRSALTSNEVEQVQGHLQFLPTTAAQQAEPRGKRA